MKAFLRTISVVLLSVMMFAAIVPCISAVDIKDSALNSASSTEYTREYTFNSTNKMDQANAMLTDPAKYNGTKNFKEIYDIFKNEIKNNTNGYSFGTPTTPIGSVSKASWHTTSVKLPEITEDHPRLLVTRDNIPTIRKALEERNPTNERFFALLDMNVAEKRAYDANGEPMDTVVNGKANGGINSGKLGAAKADFFGRAGTHNYDGYYLEVIQVKALGYLIDGHEVYGKQAIHCMKQLLRTLNIKKINSNQEREFGNVMFTAALVYDWCYDLLDAEDKKQLIAGVEYKVGKVTNDYGTSFSVNFPPSKVGAVSGHGSERQVLRDMLAAAIAFHGDNSSWYEYIGTLVFEHYVPVRNYYFRSGISQQGVGTYASGRHIADMFSAWLLMTSTGSQPYENIDKTVRNFLGYEITPGKIFTDGDGSGLYQNNYEFRALAYMTAYMFEDEAMLAQARDMLPKQAFGTDKKMDLTIELHSALYVALTGMSDITPAADKYEGMPLIQYNGSPVGQYVTHEKFGVTDSASVFMKIKERSTANHEHADAGNFMIYYKGMLTADGGVYNGYGGAHTRYYHQATVAHNSILVYDSSKANVNSSDLATKWYSGGQIWPAEVQTLDALKNSESMHAGNVIGNRHGYYDAAQTSPKFAYINGNLAFAYPSETVDKLGRRMLTVYTGDDDVPMLFFVYDTVTAKNQSYEKKFLLQIASSDAPTVSGNTVTTVNGNGKLVLTSLSSDISISKVGGRTYGTDGKYVAASSKNYLINGKQNSTTNDYDVGTWGRVEIKATNASKSSKMLNAMYVTDKSNNTAYKMEAITGISTNLSAGDFEGAVFNVNGKGFAAVFAKKDLTGGRTGTDGQYLTYNTLSFTTSGSSTMTYYVDGLAAGNWNITVDGKSYGSVRTGYGLITFDAPAGNVVLTKESEEVATLRTELLNALGTKISNASNTYTAESYAEYSIAYDSIRSQINAADDVATLNAINVSTLKSNAENKLVSVASILQNKKSELLSALGTKISNSNSTYTADSYTAYSNAFDAITSKINSASDLDALNAIDVVALKLAAENKLVTVDNAIANKKAELLSALGSKISNSNSKYTADSYTAYSNAFDAITSKINSASDLNALNAIDVASLKKAAENKLVTVANAIANKKAELLSALGSKISNSNSKYTADSYTAYSDAFDAITSKINSASDLDTLNAIYVPSLKKAAEDKLVLTPEPEVPDELATLKAELLNILGTKISNANNTYTAESYAIYSTAYDDVYSAITSATDAAELNAINVAALKANAEDRLITVADVMLAKKSELLTTLGAKIKNDDGKYTDESYKAYTDAFDAITLSINSAKDLETLNAIDVSALKSEAEQKLEVAPIPVPIDKSALIAEIDKAEALDKNEYTSSSWTALEAALNAANAVNNNADATQEQVNTAKNNLAAAIGALEKLSADVPGDETTDSTEESTEKSTEESTKDTSDDKDDNKDYQIKFSGCGSSIALSAIAVVSAFGMALVIKKKD